jgi:hypothetical protein
MEAALRMELERLVGDLVDGRFDDIYQSGRCPRATASDLRRVITAYGGTLVRPPEAVWRTVWVEAVVVEAKRLSVIIDLWTVEEGKSDLSLLVDAVRDGETFRVAIDDLRVM